MSDFIVERKVNRIGDKDWLKFYVPALSVALYTDTNIVLELPDGLAYVQNNG